VQCDPGSFATGHIYLAPRDHHLTIEDGRLSLNRAAKEHCTRPTADPLFRSAAAARRRAVIGVVLTGSADDGVSGLIAIKAAGGLSIAQDPNEGEIGGRGEEDGPVPWRRAAHRGRGQADSGTLATRRAFPHETHWE
jgi:chemotaxis response regulator CheB